MPTCEILIESAEAIKSHSRSSFLCCVGKLSPFSQNAWKAAVIQLIMSFTTAVCVTYYHLCQQPECSHLSSISNGTVIATTADSGSVAREQVPTEIMTKECGKTPQPRFYTLAPSLVRGWKCTLEVSPVWPLALFTWRPWGKSCLPLLLLLLQLSLDTAFLD